MTNTLKWRFGKLPTSDEVLKLVTDKIITKEEARNILFNEEVETERDKESLEQEIKFLREMVDKLANRTKIVEVIKEIQVPYYHYHWVQPYSGWSSNITLCGSSNAITSAGSSNLLLNNTTATSNCAFTDIQTF